MEKKSLPICLIIYLLCTSRHFASGATSYSVDLSGPGCDNNEGYALKDMNDEAVVFALPQYNAVATRDHCDVKLTTDEGRRIQFLIDMIKFNECGIEIFIFDTLIDANPIYYLRCSDNSKPPIFGKSKFNYLRIRVRKATPESRVYEFRLKAKNDLGPTLQFEQASETFYQEPLEPGAIAGIGVAAAIIIIALILVAIYLCIRGRSSNQEKYGTSNTHGESSVYTTGRVELPTSQPMKSSSPPVHKETRKENTAQWKTSEAPRPRKIRRMEPTPTMPTPRDPARKGLGDRRRSGDREVRTASRTRPSTKTTREERIHHTRMKPPAYEDL